MHHIFFLISGNYIMKENYITKNKANTIKFAYNAGLSVYYGVSACLDLF